MKKIVLIALLVVVIIVAAVLGLAKKDTDAAGVCSVTVSCETVFENGGSTDVFPSDGKILHVEEAEFFRGDTAFDVISRALEENGIEADFEDSAYGKYIKGIANLSEGDFGDGSGWLFMVNAEFADVGSSLYEVKDKDALQVVYTCNMGNDLD